MSPAGWPFDPSFMALALDLARQSRPSPNPRVGAVVVKDGEIVGRGFHARAGMPHAEIVALEESGPAARGADLYVTLEPCAHHGRTGPCCAAIERCGVRRVAIGMIDPDPRVNGKGVAALTGAGVELTVGVLEGACRSLLRGYVAHRTTGRPLVTLKAAVTLDGFLATESGDSKWISSLESRRAAHAMRAEADAVLVGVRTVARDDPELSVRHVPGESPLRVVLDSRLEIPREARLLNTPDVGRVIIAHTGAGKEAAEELGRFQHVETLETKATAEGRVDIAELVRRLGERGVLSLLVEGGASVHAAFARAGLADRVALFVAPKIFGRGLSWLPLEAAATVAEAPCLGDVEITPFGEDVLVAGNLRLGPAESAAR